jgi:hypothetical protein
MKFIVHAVEVVFFYFLKIDLTIGFTSTVPNYKPTVRKVQYTVNWFSKAMTPRSNIFLQLRSNVSVTMYDLNFKIVDTSSKLI